MPYHEITVPELGIDDVPITVSCWLTKRGARVSRGEPIVEILAGAATVDLPSPAEGVLVERLVCEDEPIQTGQTLALIES